jgi:protein-L-isoaspartate(D-aspartate) O-methyltransferase
MTDFSAERRHMVDGQVRPADVTDLRIISAMMTVPREQFVPAEAVKLAYLDLGLKVGGAPNAPRCLIKPMVLAKLVQAVELEPADRVLVIGSATGYSAAILSHIAAHVTALEQDEALASMAQSALAPLANVTAVKGTLADGWAAAAPYDAILIDGAVERLPQAISRQLKDGGRLVCVLGVSPGGSAMLYRRSGDECSGRPIFDATAALLPGFAKAPAFAF